MKGYVYSPDKSDNLDKQDNRGNQDRFYKKRVRVPLLLLVALILVVIVLISVLAIPFLNEPGIGDGGAGGQDGASATTCAEEYISNFRCSADSTHIERQYQYTNCTTIWKQFQYCPDGCSGGVCL